MDSALPAYVILFTDRFYVTNIECIILQQLNYKFPRRNAAKPDLSLRHKVLFRGRSQKPHMILIMCTDTGTASVV
jgi:hypothetical protein